MNPTRLYGRLMRGSLNNVSFVDFRRLVEACGFELDRVRGSHHVFRHKSIPGRLNLQPVKGEVKAYQIRQFLYLAKKYDLEPKE